jgi:hypothetical protein
MRTKTTLAAAAILAAGLASSMAQANVYSLNIVGYYNVPLTGQTVALANSLKAAAGTPEQNRADKVIPFVDGDNIQVWTGTAWALWTMDSASTTGWINPLNADAPLATLPVLSQGKGFFYGRNGSATNITFVGDVATGTNVVTLPVGLTPSGSPLPYGGLVTSPTGINLQVQDGDNIQKWTGSSWNVSTRDSAEPTGWSPGTEPTLIVGQGFFYGNNGTLPFNWTQILNAQ